jgi:hypothetical protein
MQLPHELEHPIARIPCQGVVEEMADVELHGSALLGRDGGTVGRIALAIEVRSGKEKARAMAQDEGKREGRGWTARDGQLGARGSSTNSNDDSPGSKHSQAL